MMPVEEVKLQNWAKGINNQAPDNRLPEQFVRDLLNLDPNGPNLTQRVGYEKVVPGASCRAVMALGHKVLFVDGTDLIEFDTRTDATRVLQTVAGAGPVASCVHNHELFLSTVNETLRFDGRTLRPWGVPNMTQQPTVAITEQKDGRRLYAATFVNAQGEEGGTAPAANVPEGRLTFTLPAPPTGGRVRLYVSALNGKTLYLQGEASTAGTMVVNRPVDDTQTLATMHLRAPLAAQHLASYNGTIVMATGAALFITQPMTPHLIDPARRFFQYPTDVGLLASGLRGVYVSADKCYQLDRIEGDSPQQRTIFDYPAVSGTGTILPDGRATWLTRYGMAVESPDPREGVVEPNRGTFVPAESSAGTSGVVDNNGNQMVVTTLKGGASPNALAASDYFEAEVIRP